MDELWKHIREFIIGGEKFFFLAKHGRSSGIMISMDLNYDLMELSILNNLNYCLPSKHLCR